MRCSAVSIIGAPMDLGAGRRGVDMGPSAIRVANLQHCLQSLGYEVEDRGNVLVEQAESVPVGTESARYLAQITQTCSRVASVVQEECGQGKTPLVLGGDHSIAAGTVAGVAAHYRAQGQRIGLIWFDAHADMNTPETSPSGNVHGMPLACCLGRGPLELTEIAGFAPKVDARNTVLICIREVDEAERNIVREMGVHVFTMREIDERGLMPVMTDALALALDGTAGFHLSLDMDALDPGEAPGVGTPVRGGVTYREAHLAMEMVGDSHGLVSLEVVEVNPVVDEANRTALLAVELVASALGKRIL